ncbi:MAG: 16S rRNA (uracil(1498)-N(3))-methyltransferase [Candidatus Cloacimonetes bacterium]|nr:16S rRNA (uracil(1498)-N(3))-methyltransferase [Candidatus Cloacimonadota bacterium]
MPGFYAPDLELKSVKIKISGEEFHHIIHVFRKKTGDDIRLTNGKGILAEATITEQKRDYLIAGIDKLDCRKPSQPEMAVAFSLLKNKHDHLIIEKLTELGIRKFFPLLCERSIRKPSHEPEDKLRKVAITAIKQCDNAFLPEIYQVMELPRFLEFIAESDFSLLAGLESEAETPLLNLIRDNHKPLCIIIGPEGGFSPFERELFIKKEILTFSLGNHVLRAETAAIAAVAQINGYFLSLDPQYY